MADPLAHRLSRLRRLNLALALVLVLLSLMLFQLERSRLPVPATPLTTLDPATLARAEIHSAAGVLTLERKAGQWQLTAPISGPVDPLRSQALLALLTTPSRTQLPYPSERAEEFGLDQSELRINLGTNLWLEFGAEAPLNGGRYLRIGDTIHLINRRFFYYLSGPAEGFLAAPENQ